MSTGRFSFSLPDLLVGLFCVALIGVLVAVALGRGRRDSRGLAAVPADLRSIHQALLGFGLDNGGYFPGLGPGGELEDADPAARYVLLTGGGYLDARRLVSPADPDPAARYSYAVLDIAVPGARRDAWSVEARPDAPLLSERPEQGAWSGWVMLHRLAVTPEAGLPVFAESARMDTRYDPAGPWNLDDDLFVAEGSDDAHLVAP